MSSPVLRGDCRRARESISAQLDSEQAELDSARLSAHLRNCAACSSLARELAAITVHLRAAQLERPELEIWLPRRPMAAALRTARVCAAAAAAVVIAAGLSFVAGHYAAVSLPHASTIVRPGVSAPRADLIERRVLAMLREARSRPSRREGRLIFA
jgi:predicted anti-sigma-YlaC factor YlaD